MLHRNSGGSWTQLQLIMDQVGGADEKEEKKIINVQQGSPFCKEIFNFHGLEKHLFFCKRP